MLSQASLTEDNVAYIVYEADNISAGADRRENGEDEFGFDKDIVLSSVFNILSGNEGNKSYYLRNLDEKNKVNYPTNVGK